LVVVVVGDGELELLSGVPAVNVTGMAPFVPTLRRTVSIAGAAVVVGATFVVGATAATAAGDGDSSSSAFELVTANGRPVTPITRRRPHQPTPCAGGFPFR